MGTTKGVLNLQNPLLFALSGEDLTIGTEGNDDIIFVTQNVERLRIKGDGSTILSSTIDFILANNDYLLAKNAAGSGNLSVLKADSSDNTVLNAGTGKVNKLSINGTSLVEVDGTGIYPATDGNGSTSNLGSATKGWSNIHLSDGTNRSSLAQSTGLSLSFPSGQALTFKEGTTNRWSIAATTGALTSDSSNGGGIILPRGLTNLKGLLTGTSSFDTDITTNITATQGLGISQDKANGSDHVVLVDYGAGAQGVRVNFLKTRSGNSNGNANTIVNSGDNVATLLFCAADGTAYRPCAAILANVDGTPGANDMPGSLDFQVSPDGSATLTSFLKISQSSGFQLYRTNTAGGTTGAQTINRPNGSVNFAAAATSLVVTNSMVSTSSNIIAVLQTNDATARIASVVPGSGSFTIYLTAAATAETRCAFWVFN